jgi:eukaryotic-like serine/threonine-protein kinase
LIIAGHILGERFEVRRRIGAGGMGEVFEAFDRDRGDVVAIKTLARTDGDTFARFKREFRALQTTAHPNLVSIRELVCAGDLWFFTMELVGGRHFLDHVRGDPDRLRAALRQLVAGLCALHDAGLIHRDVKPSNVMVTTEGRVVILDFGLVTNLDPAGQSSVAGPIGTVEYMAPEQATGRHVGEAADWYAVGVMLYEALTGKVPHLGHALQILVEKQQVEPVPVRERVPDAPPDLATLCMELLRIEPSTRPTGAEIARRLGVERGDERRSVTPLQSGSAIFVGRERELAELRAAAATARAAPRVHLVIGESGIGKSELVARFARELTSADPDAVVLTGRCYERESVPYKALDGVADGLAQVLARMRDGDAYAIMPARPALLVSLFPVYQRVVAVATAAAPGQDAGEPLEQRRRMFAALRELLRGLGRVRRVVITIDDLQWADADSFLLLRELLRGGDAPAALVIATVRGDDPAADTLRTELDGLAVTRTRLGPLSAEECHVLAERLVPNAAARFDLDRVSREAGGHPMFLQEILRHVEVDDGPGGAITLDDALAARVALLRAEARSVLEVACLAGAPISLETAALACRLDATAVTRAIATLRVATLVRETQRGRHLALEPYHDRVREAVGGRIDPAVRRELHARIAFALEAAQETRDPQLLLRNFLLADLPDRAVRYAEEAAQRSEAAYAFDQAAELWRTALDAIPRDAADRRRVLLHLGQALINAGRGAEAAEHFLAAAVDADRPTRLECHRHAAEQLIISGHIAPGLEALEALLAEIGVRTPKTPRAILASLLWHRMQIRVRGLGFRERHRREIADARILELDVLKVAAHSLALVDSIRGMDFQTRELLMALRTGHKPHIARAMILESMFYTTASNPKRARMLLERVGEIGADVSDPYMRALLSGARGMMAYFSGDVVSAVTILEDALGSLRQAPGNNWEYSTGRLFLLFALRFIGDYAALRARYEQFSVEAAHRGDRYLDSTMRRACVPMWLAADDAAAAVRELERATWVPQATGFHVQHFHELVAWGEISLYEGRLDPRGRFDEMFARLQRSMLLRVESIRIQYGYLRGRLALAGHVAPGDAARAARQLGKDPNPMAQVWSMLLSAGEQVARDRGGAAACLERAVAAADRAGMWSTAAAARYRLADLRGDGARRDEASAALTALAVHAPAKMCDLLVPLRTRRALPTAT